MLVALVLTTVIMLTGCGTGITGQAGGDADGRPCAEVHAELDEADRVRAETFGGGPGGREATETIRRVIEERSDCFHDDQTIPSATDVVPAGMADAAQGVADTCGSVTTGMVELMDPDSEPADDPRDALAEARGRSAPGLWPDGEPTRSTEDADGVGFDLYDDGRYRGWVMFEEVEGGWSARLAMSCA